MACLLPAPVLGQEAVDLQLGPLARQIARIIGNVVTAMSLLRGRVDLAGDVTWSSILPCLSSRGDGANSFLTLGERAGVGEEAISAFPVLSFRAHSPPGGAEC